MSTTAKALPDWNAPRESHRQPGYLVQRMMAVLVAMIMAAGLTLLLGPIVGPGIMMLINAFLGVAFLIWAINQGLLALRSTKATLARAEDEPRLWNVVHGVVSDLNAAVPTIYVVEEGGPNALACHARGPVMAVTRSLLDSYTHTELEAVVAHCVVRLLSPDIERAAFGIALGPLGTRAIPRVGTADDVRAAATTRFPPALISAIEKADPRSGRFAAFWFVAEGSSHRAVDKRITTLGEL